ncbi:MAG: hypothetical protein GXO39_07875 [Thermotogae bacterium]|nr:hypothetical protein [Thermotogota bacterium]
MRRKAKITKTNSDAPPKVKRGELFSSYFLSEGIRNTEDWKRLSDEELNELFKKVKDIYDNFAGKNKNPNEANTEEEIIIPFLKEIFGFLYRKQELLERTMVLDFVLFPDEESKERFDSAGKDNKLWHEAVCILEAKRWNRKLDRADKSDKDDPRVPSNQILRYLSSAEVRSNGKILWGILTNGKVWRLYYRKAPSQLDGFVEFDLEEMFGEVDLFNNLEQKKEKFKTFYLLFRKEAFIPTEWRHKTFLEIALEEGRKWEERVTEDLKEKIFYEVVPLIAKGFLESVKRKDRDVKMDDNLIEKIYDNTLIFLYRLLFLLYAEDRDLLPVRKQEYKDYSLSEIREEVKKRIKENHQLSSTASTFYDKLRNLFRIINKGDETLKIPPYNGGLFDSEKHPFLEEYAVPDKYLVPAIYKLSFHDNRWINYRDLSVRHLGGIYEGLLEFKLKVADKNLGVKKSKGKEVYYPTDDEGKIKVRKGELYLTNDKSERKATGSYYTPDYIVQYIVKNTLEPLIQEKIKEFERLKEELDGITNREQLLELARKYRVDPKTYKDGKATGDKGINALKNEILQKKDPAREVLKLKILDPATGSGHFLVGAVDYLADRIVELIEEFSHQEFFKGEEYTSPLEEDLERIRSSIKENALRNNYEVDEEKLDDKNLIKRIILKRCIYGVDVNPLAVELAKVSLWLHTFTVGAPLSFLDHHIKCGNSLIGADPEEVGRVIKTSGRLLGWVFEDIMKVVEKIKQIEEISDADITEVERSAELYKNAAKIIEPYKRILDIYVADMFLRPEKKKEIKNYLSPLALIDGSRGNPLQVVSGKVQLHDRYKELLYRSLQLAKEKRFFHWKLEFPEVWYDENGAKENGGFDVVVGNPPYVRQERIGELKSYLAMAFGDLYTSTADIYVYFHYRGISLLREGGLFSMITSNKFMRAKYGEKLREFLSENTDILKIIDYSGVRVFEDATVDVMIGVFRKGEKRNEGTDVELKYSNRRFVMPQRRFTGSMWILAEEDMFRLKEKLEKAGKPLKEWDINIYRGVLTGYNDAFIIDSKTRDQILSNCGTEEERRRTEEIIKPILRGKDIKRYYYKWAGLWLIGTFPSLKLDINAFPSLKTYLMGFGEKLNQDGKPGHRKKTNNEWFETQDTIAYYHEFEKNKIVFNKTTKIDYAFAYDSKGYYVNQSTYILTSERYDLKILLAILNSNLFKVMYSTFYSGGGIEGEITIFTLEEFPIPQITPANERMVEKLRHLVDDMIKMSNQKMILEDFLNDSLQHGTDEMIRVIKILEKHKDWEDNASLTLQKEIAQSIINSLTEKIEKTDRLIDSIVYHLYGLNDEEIKTVEEFIGQNQRSR